MKLRSVLLVLYLVLILVPIYWMLNMSLKENEEITGLFSLWPRQLTWGNYAVIFGDASWYTGYINSLIYVAINTTISVVVALPAAYAFSRYRFLGDRHMFFWLLSNRSENAPSSPTKEAISSLNSDWPFRKRVAWVCSWMMTEAMSNRE